MNLEIVVNDYLLAWYLLYGASLSQELDKFKKSLYTKYKVEYNLAYKDLSEIIKYGKDFIPDNDTIYNSVLESQLFKSMKKETSKHRNHIEKIWENSNQDIEKYIKEIFKVHFPKEIKLFMVHPRLEVTKFYKDCNALIWGSEKDKYDVLTFMVKNIALGFLKNDSKDPLYESLFNAVIELSVINEIGSKISKTPSYELGDPNLILIKKQIYPYWLMYLGYTEKEDMLNKMINDRIGFDITNYNIDKSLKKLDITQFIEYILKNKNKILTVTEIKKEEDLEII